MIKNFVLAAIISSALIISSCSESPNSASTDKYSDIQSFVVAEYNTTGFELQDATFETGMTITPIVTDDYGNTQRLEPPNKKPSHVNKMMAIGMILRQLNLSEEQIELVKEYMIAHRLCEWEWLKMLEKSRREIIAKGNEARQEIIKSYKNGEMTREEAARAIHQLNNRIREALQNNPVNEIVRKGLQDCWNVFLSNIKSVLTDEQLAKFEQWLERIANGGSNLDGRKKDDRKNDDGKNTGGGRSTDGGTGNTRG